ncbi:hypothetical protein EW146_g1821 [Bondarzewia mesenterica]|uniref:Uncharacterized protein n=1 Tax=Bondarzewia mesenterica TaxID=1095465 RepID=A0A4S4M8T6_9AGAM|nr:hypothetical protein EW146_g1821 [Bondarzewia mesenterica]
MCEPAANLKRSKAIVNEFHRKNLLLAKSTYRKPTPPPRPRKPPFDQTPQSVQELCSHTSELPIMWPPKYLPTWHCMTLEDMEEEAEQKRGDDLIRESIQQMRREREQQLTLPP